ncbi:MAG TPA: holo-ACP synthase [Campylobacterales bacterium]|nr:holo-ACP synthase [Campylobacterales bacterium]
MIGVDIVKIERIENMIKRFGNKGLERFLNSSEIDSAKKVETIAGYWAAKEAIAKALKSGIGKELSFKDITIFKEKSGAPNFKLSKHLNKKFNIKDCSLSISHDGEYAIAVAAIELASSNKS